MDFGKVETPDLDNIDFTLPPDHVDNAGILGGKRRSKIEAAVGCAKWGRKDWIGKIYPKGTKEANFLNEYGSRFGAIELNATFYKLPSVKQVSAWREKVGDHFKFCPKFTDKITHIKRLKDAEHYTQIFLDGIAAFGNNLGPAFLQTPPNYATKNFDAFEAYMHSLPKDFDVFVEMRHPNWFADEKSNTAAFELLKETKAGAVITDAAGRRDCVHMRLTTPSAFIRFVGNGLHPTDYQRCDEWVARIKNWIDIGLERVFFFMHQHEELHSPELCKYFIEKLNDACNLNVQVPEFVEA